MKMLVDLQGRIDLLKWAIALDGIYESSDPCQNSVLLDYKKYSIIENLFLKPFLSFLPSLNHPILI